MIQPADIITMIKNGQNPEQVLIKILEEGVSDMNPLFSNLLSLAKNNRTTDIEKIARNLCAERGIDFDKEFNSFKYNLFNNSLNFK